MKIIFSPNPEQNVTRLFMAIDVKTRNRSYHGLPELVRNFHNQQAICHAKGIDGLIFPYGDKTIAITTGKKRAKVVRKTWPVEEPEEVVNLLKGQIVQE